MTIFNPSHSYKEQMTKIERTILRNDIRYWFAMRRLERRGLRATEAKLRELIQKLRKKT